MVVVFGSINVDFVMQLERLPAPGETVLGGDYFLVQGGKGANQACAAARASAAKVAMAGCVGGDDWAEFSVSRLREARVDLSCVNEVDAPTGCASICVDANGENAIAVASGANQLARADQIAHGMLDPQALLVLQMETPPEENWKAIRQAHASGARVMLNVAPAAAVPAEALDCVDVLVVNEIEARMVAEALGLTGGGPDEVAAWLAKTHALVCVATLGARGAVFSDGSAIARVASPPADAVDTTGAGDAFVGVLAASLDAGQDMCAAIERAAVAGALTCETAGAQSSFPSAEAIDTRLQSARDQGVWG